MSNVKSRTVELATDAFARLPLGVKRRVLYYRSHRRLLSKRPATFTEKIQWRILHDRREIIARGGNKVSMKKHAEKAAPSVLIPETLWHGQDLGEIWNNDWKCSWVLKPLTTSGFVAFGQGQIAESNISSAELQEWDHEFVFRVLGEWAYGQTKPGFILERKIATADGDSPDDIRFFVFDGEVRMIQIDSPRVRDVQRRFYSPDWKPLDVRQGGKILADPHPAPANLSEMISIAQDIGAGYDFIRVDLYTTGDKIYFGEITPYPAGGLAPFDDHTFDLKLGSYWHLPIDQS